MNKKDILEIKRRFKKEACTFTRMCGCYVDADRNKITKIGETFLNLEDEDRKSTRLNSSHITRSRMPSSA